MSPPKKVPAALAVVDLPKAPKLMAAGGKLALMEKIRDLSNNGERIISALFRVMDTSESNKEVLSAAELLLLFGFGRPIETKVSLDATPEASPSGAGVKGLTAEQLHALASGNLPAREQTVDVVAEPADVKD